VSAVINLDTAREWLGRVDVQADRATREPIVALFATLDREDPAPDAGDELPPLGHWLYFRPPERQSAIAADGGARQSFLPPIELPHRSCVETRTRFHRALRVGDAISRASRIVDIAERAGRSGAIVEVLVRDEIGDAEGVAITEQRRLVFHRGREPASNEAPLWPRGAPLWSRRFEADPRALFRYSAVIFDARRVHYDRPYATFVEGYPGLVVQSGLVAALLLDLLRPRAPTARFVHVAFHSLRPLFDTGPISLFGRPLDAQKVELWAEDEGGALAVEVVATLAAGVAWNEGPRG
jgi:3-methylfumaryl-CoA hydratase